MRILVKNGRIINPKTGFDQKADLSIEDDIIKEICPQIPEQGFDKIINAEGKIVVPGFIDLHVHLREPGYEHKETIETGTKAAAKGGFTTVACMPNTSPALDSVENLEKLKQIIQKTAAIRVYPIGAITEGIRGEILTEHERLIEAGAIALSDDGRTTMNAGYMEVAFNHSRALEIPIITHSEDHEITSQYTEEVYPIEAEYNIVRRDIALCESQNGILHVAHVSGKEALKAIREAKLRGVRVTCEAAPHHFALNSSCVDVKDVYSKVNPPIREQAEQRAVIEGIMDGTIDIIATDHAPHDKASKETIYGSAAYGISGIETAFQVAYTHLVLKEGLPFKKLIEMMTSRPAEIAKLSQTGSLEKGNWADITILNTDYESVIDSEAFISKGKNTPFNGMKVKGLVEMTICSGKIVFNY